VINGSHAGPSWSEAPECVCRVAQHPEDLLAADLLLELATPLLQVAAVLTKLNDARQKPAGAGSVPVGPITWDLVAEEVKNAKQWGKLARTLKDSNDWAGLLKEQVGSAHGQQYLKGLLNGPVTWARLQQVLGSREKLETLAGSEERVKDVLSWASKREQERSDAQKKRLQARFFVGETLYRGLGRKNFDLPGSNASAMPSAATEVRWVNYLRLLRHYPGLVREVPWAVLDFCEAALERCLKRPFTLHRWRRTGKDSRQLYDTRYRRALDVAASAADRQLVEGIWRLVEKRRLLDLEYRLHTLGGLWLLVHGPAAVVLLVLLLEHVGMSMRFGGF
jgi:hypothetical protein